MHMINENLDTLVVPDRRATERMGEEKALEQLHEKGRPDCGDLHGIVYCLWGCYEDIDYSDHDR
jgi:hypothetical protein